MKHPAVSPERIQTVIDRVGGVRPYASRVGVSQSTVYRWLNPRVCPALDKQRRIARLHAEYATPEEAKMVYWVLMAVGESLHNEITNAICDEQPPKAIRLLRSEMWQVRRWTSDYLYVAKDKIENE